MVGSSLGPYKILEPLGAGGMGEVYLGEDTRLGRKVAIKVLPAEFASDPERLARFEQEARAAAALNHPHIAVVHDIGSETGDDGETTHFMVQEHLEGDTLREPLKKGALPVKKALPLVIETAEALAAAHSAGIVHRDLKPENIFITKEGHAKVLDFGLAKLMEFAPAMSPGTDASKSPTMLGTVAGQVMGTAGYMAPEQVQGDGEIDHRADIFAFGCVLYETVAGKQAFAGRNVLDTLGRIVDQDPDSLTDVNPRLPAETQRIVRKCLAKEPAKRYQTAADLVVDLRALSADVESGTAAPVVAAAPAKPVPVGAARGNPWKLAIPLAAAALLVGALAGWWAMRPAPQSPVRLELTTGEAIFSNLGASVALSPDGTRIVYTTGGAARQLMIRSFNQLDSTMLASGQGVSEAPYQPFFSADGQWVGFATGTELKRVPVSGGTALSIVDVNRNRGADWGPNDTIVFTPDPQSGLFLVPSVGGEPRPLTELAEGEATHRWPRFLPGGKAVLFTVNSVSAGDFDAASIHVVDVEAGTRKVVYEGGHDGRYVPSGHLVYANAGTLFAAPFDLDALEVTGSAAPVVEDVTTNANGGAQFGFSTTGVLAYVSGAGGGGVVERTLVWIDRQGNTEPLPFATRGYRRPRLSPDGASIAVEIIGDATDIWILDVATGTQQRLTFEGTNSHPVWSPDGEWVYFRSDRGGDSDIWRKPVDLSSEAALVHDAEGAQIPWSILADGSALLFYDSSSGPPDIAMISLDGEPAPVVLVDTDAVTLLPSVSPDGRFFAFDSNETGLRQIHVQEIATGSRRTISTAGGIYPTWSRDGTEIFYRTSPTEFSFVEVDTGAELSPSAPRVLFNVPNAVGEFDVTADGQRILVPMAGEVAAAAEEPTTPLINVVLNWFEDLKERVPTGR